MATTSARCKFEHHGAQSARSIHGCWTCRTRKKKCDENRPACATCISLALNCDGYGEKPEWMDNGRLQKERALKIKSIVGQNNAKRRKSYLSNMDIVHEQSPELLARTSNYLSKETPRSAPSTDLTQFHAAHTDLIVCEKNRWGFLEENNFAIASAFNDFDYENSAWLGEPFLSADCLIFPESSGSSGASQHSGTTTPNISTSDNIQETACVPARDGVYQRAINASTADWSSSSYPISAPSLTGTNKDSQQYPIFPVSPEDSVLQRKTEDHLSMHYLDEVFYVQYPFYNLPKKQSRGWLFSTLRRTKPVYHGILALSQRHLQSTREFPLLSTLSQNFDYYDVALREMEAVQGECSSVGEVVAITCILQILFHKIFAGGTGDWQHNILAAGPFISSLLPTITKPTNTSSTSLDRGVTRQLQHEEDTEKDNSEIEVLFCSFIWLDIFASASTRSPLLLNIDHKHVLQIFGIKLERLFGCENWVVSHIFDIVCLDMWKKEAEGTRQLSVAELVKRGARIEESLRENLKVLEDSHFLGWGLPRSQSNNLSPSQAVVTSIFALSALTYLHIVISGAHPELPEIMESVSKTVNAFRCLDDPRLLRSLVWPFCVSGCLAVGGQQGFFRELFAKAEITSSNLGTCLQAFRVVEKCWEIRKTSLSECDWVFIMNRQGCNILLV